MWRHFDLVPKSIALFSFSTFSAPHNRIVLFFVSLFHLKSIFVLSKQEQCHLLLYKSRPTTPTFFPQVSSQEVSPTHTSLFHIQPYPSHTKTPISQCQKTPTPLQINPATTQLQSRRTGTPAQKSFPQTGSSLTTSISHYWKIQAHVQVSPYPRFLLKKPRKPLHSKTRKARISSTCFLLKARALPDRCG